MNKNIKTFTSYHHRSNATVPLDSITNNDHQLAVKIDTLSIDTDKNIKTFTSYHHRSNAPVSVDFTPDSHRLSLNRFVDKVAPEPIPEASSSSSTNMNKKLIKTFTSYQNRSNDTLSLESFITGYHRSSNKVEPIAEASSSSTNMN
jgi:hypothetical protein